MLTKRTIKDFITKKIASNSTWAIRTLKLLYALQTNSEKNSAKSLAINKQGFSKNDAEILTHLAKQTVLTENQLSLLHIILPKYWKQVYKACDKQKMHKSIIASFPVEQQELKLF
jgi:hypothetical protein